MIALVVALGQKQYTAQNGQLKQLSDITYLVKAETEEYSGLFPVVLPIPWNQRSLFPSLPALYKLEINTVPGFKNAPTAQFGGCEFIKQVDLDGFIKSQLLPPTSPATQATAKAAA